MGRTPLLLVFGKHWDTLGGCLLQPDRELYRGAALPFIEKHVLLEGRRAAYIHECNIIIDSPAGLGPEERRKHLAGELAGQERMILGIFSETVDAGLPLPWFFQREFDWGIMDEILRINAKSPRRIANLIERQTPGQVEIATRSVSPGPDVHPNERGVETARKSIMRSIALSWHRNRELYRLVEGLRREDPDRAIMITRGYAHAGMERFYRGEDYEVSCHAGGSIVPRFSSEAIIASYGNGFGGAELERFARLTAAFTEYLNARWDSEPHPSMRAAGEVEESVRLLKLGARMHALGLESLRREAPAA